MYDARGHGESDPAPEGEKYTYETLASDMAAVAAEVGEGDRVVLAGHSMGAHTAAAFALAEPDRVAGLVAIGPASRASRRPEETIEYWAGLAGGLERGGVEGFIEVYDDGSHNPEWRDVVLRLARTRLALHKDLDAVAQALREVTVSVPFDGLEALEGLEVPTLVVASHDEADPGHPWDVATEWTERIPNARMISEDEGESPLAWQGGKLSREIAAFCETEDSGRAERFYGVAWPRARRRGSPRGRRAGGPTRSRRSRRPCCRPGQAEGRPREVCPR